MKPWRRPIGAAEVMTFRRWYPWCASSFNVWLFARYYISREPAEIIKNGWIDTFPRGPGRSG
jgi:hypothetical protein